MSSTMKSIAKFSRHVDIVMSVGLCIAAVVCLVLGENVLAAWLVASFLVSVAMVYFQPAKVVSTWMESRFLRKR